METQAKKQRREVITDNSSERISVITDKERLSLKQEFKGRLPEELSDYKVIILNVQEARRLQGILNSWLKRKP